MRNKASKYHRYAGESWRWVQRTTSPSRSAVSHRMWYQNITLPPFSLSILYKAGPALRALCLPCFLCFSVCSNRPPFLPERAAHKNSPSRLKQKKPRKTLWLSIFKMNPFRLNQPRDVVFQKETNRVVPAQGPKIVLFPITATTMNKHHPSPFSPSARSFGPTSCHSPALRDSNTRPFAVRATSAKFH